MQNVPKVPLSIVLQINDLTPSKSTFTTDINSLQLNAKKIYQMELFSGCHARLHLYQRGQNALYSQPARSPNSIAASISDSGKWWYAKPTPFTPEFSKFIEECIAAGYSEPNPQKWMELLTAPSPGEEAPS